MTAPAALPGVTPPRLHGSLEQVASLFAALSNAQGMVEPVPADREHATKLYRYVSADALAKTVSPALQQCSLALLPLGWKVVPHGERGEHAMLQRAWWLTHADGAHVELRVDWPVVPDREHTLGQAVAVALTATYRYLLRDLGLASRMQDEAADDLDDGATDGPRSTTPERVDPIAQAKVEADAKADRPVQGLPKLTADDVPAPYDERNVWLGERLRERHATRAEVSWWLERIRRPALLDQMPADLAKTLNYLNTTHGRAQLRHVPEPPGRD